MEAPVERPRDERWYEAIAWCATALFVAISLREWFPGAGGTPNYRYSFLFLIPLAWLGYHLRGTLRLAPLHLGLFCSALLLHDLGAFGCYERGYFGLEFDGYVHFYFGFVGGLVFARWLDPRFERQRGLLWVAVLLCVMGVGGIHEMVEGLSTWLLGKNGMFKLGGDPFDTQKDLGNNFAGCMVALAARWIAGRRARSS